MKLKAEQIESLSGQITNKLFELGSDLGSDPCHRIAFMGGNYPDDEIQQGGLSKESFDRFIIGIILDFYDK